MEIIQVSITIAQAGWNQNTFAVQIKNPQFFFSSAFFSLALHLLSFEDQRWLSFYRIERMELNIYYFYYTTLLAKQY